MCTLLCINKSFNNILRNRKIAFDVTHFAPKKVADQKLYLCWKGVGRTPTFGFILKTNEKSIKNWNELLLVGSS